MSAKRTSIARNQLATKPATEIKPAAEPKPTEFVRKIHACVSDRLESEFEHFREHANIEEKRLMIEILNEHMNRSGYHGAPRSPIDREIYLYSAIERQLSDNVCVVVPRDEMVPYIEDFINKLDRRWPPKSHSSRKPESEDEIMERFASNFRTEIELFARDAGKPSFWLMSKIIARWNEINRDSQARKVPNILAVAAEIELEKLLAEKAAEAATEAAQ